MKSSRFFKAAMIAIVPLFPILLFLVFYYAPVERELGISQKIFYFHVPLAWNGLLAFMIVFVASIAYLRTQNIKFDILARAAAEIGVVFTVLTLATGMIWARTAWGAWWSWTDVRLVTYFLLLLLYLGYLMLGNSVEEESKRARFLSVFGIVAFLDVPLVFFSVRWWTSVTNHPVLFKSGMVLNGQMKVAFFSGLAIFTIFFIALLIVRNKIGKAQDELIAIKEEL